MGIFYLQDLALNPSSALRLSNANKFSLHSLCISLLSILSYVVRVPDIFEYRWVEEVGGCC